MRDYVLRRLLLLVPIMLGVTFLTFVSFRLIPGDIVDIRCGLACTDETREAMRSELGLDRPWYRQYGDWLWDVLRGDLGRTMGEGELAVSTQLERRLPVTLELVTLAMVLSLAMGIPAGIVSAVRPNGLLDWAVRFASVLWLSIPSFYLGVMLLTFAFVWFGWSPPQFGRGYVSPLDDPWLNLQEFFFPSLVLALGISALIMRLLRSSLLEVLRADYIRTAWSKGLRERSVVWRHAIKNAFIPVMTVAGLQLGGLISGTVIVESIFALNGVGFYLLRSIVTRDFVVVQSVVLLLALVYVCCNLLVDLAYAWLDPRIRLS